MSDRNKRALKLTALWLIGFHFLTVVLHSVAHKILSVEASSAQLAFILPVIIIAPLVAGLMLPRFERAGAVVLLLSMAGSFAFGLYYHFVADTHDHVAHVARLRPPVWAAVFQITAYLLLVSELLGAAVAVPSFMSRPQAFKRYAARTDF